MGVGSWGGALAPGNPSQGKKTNLKKFKLPEQTFYLQLTKNYLTVPSRKLLHARKLFDAAQ